MTPGVLILAGSRGGVDPVAAAEGVSDKALVDIEGRTMIERVIDALRDAGIAAIAASSNSPAVEAVAAMAGVRNLAAAPGPSASVAVALDALGTPLLVTTADHALLQATWVQDFVAAVPGDADVAVLLARREAIEVAAPGSRRTYLRFADGHWSGCNLFYLATPRAREAVKLWQQVDADRKRPWRIVSRLGVALLLRYLLGRLTLAEAVEALGRRAGVRAVTIACPDGLAAVDVDKANDLDFVRRHLGRA